jgi:hypothetical protein
VTTQEAHFASQIFIVCYGHSALGRGYYFNRVKAKYGYVAMTAVPDEFSLVPAANGMRRVFNYSESIFPSQTGNASHIAGLTPQMNWHHYLG